MNVALRRGQRSVSLFLGKETTRSPTAHSSPLTTHGRVPSGAEYAGLSSFSQLEPDVVKLDMSLIRDMRRGVRIFQHVWCR